MRVCADHVRQDYLRECARRSVELVSGECIVLCHAIIDVVIDVRVMECHASMDVVIGVRVVLCHQVTVVSKFSSCHAVAIQHHFSL